TNIPGIAGTLMYARLKRYATTVAALHGPIREGKVDPDVMESILTDWMDLKCDMFVKLRFGAEELGSFDTVGLEVAAAKWKAKIIKNTTGLKTDDLALEALNVKAQQRVKASDAALKRNTSGGGGFGGFSRGGGGFNP